MYCLACADRPVLFTGEMVFPWMFDDFAYLRPFKEAANLLAAKQDWGQLYRQTALQENKVTLHVCLLVCLGLLVGSSRREKMQHSSH